MHTLPAHISSTLASRSLVWTMTGSMHANHTAGNSARTRRAIFLLPDTIRYTRASDPDRSTPLPAKLWEDEMPKQTHAHDEAAWLPEVVATIDEGVVITDAQGRTTWINPGFTRLCGYTLADFQGRTPGAVLQGPATNPATVQEIRHALQQQRACTVELLNYHHAGHAYWVELHIIPLYDPAGTLVRFAATARDITARKRAETALRASEVQFRAMFEQANVGIVQVTIAGQIVMPNPRFCHLIGYSSADACRLTLRNITHPDDYAREVAFMRQLLAGDIPGFAIEKRYLHQDGRIVWGQMTATLMQDGPDVPVSTLAIVEDITERKQAEAALRESEARFRAVANLVPDLLWSTNPSGQPVWYNQRWYDYTGQTRADAHGSGWLDVIHPDDRESSRRTFQRALETGAPLRLEHRMRRADGSYRWFLVQAHPLHDEAGRIVCWYGAATDTHKERLALEEAEAALATRDQFLSIAAHELRTPLAALIGYAYLLSRMAAPGPAPLARMSEQITQQVQRLTTRIEQLLDVSRLQHGQFVIEPQPTDLAALVAQVVDDFRVTQPPDPRHTIDLECTDAPVRIMGDPSRLEQVFQNLLSNAVKYSPAGGQIRVRVATTATEAVVEVTDQGIGIPAEARARLFEPFFRASNVGSQARGFGIGLHIVREIVERHAGHIEIVSMVGHGSTFRVMLPLLPTMT